MNVLYIDSTQGTGGATKSLLDMLRYLDRSRFNPILLCHREGTFTESFKNENVKILKQKINLMQALTFDPSLRIKCKNKVVRKCIKLFGMSMKSILLMSTLLRDYFLIIYLVKSHSIQLIHFNTYSDYYLPLAAVISRCSNIRTVFHIRGKVRPKRSVRIFTRYVSGFIYVSKFVQNYFLSDGAIGKNNFCAYDGRDPKEYNMAPQRLRLDIRQSYNIPNNYKIVVCIGTLTRGKGQHTFLRAAQLVKEQESRVIFLVVGDNVPYEDDIKSELLRLRGQLRLTDCVFFLGQRNDVPEILKQSDVSVVSTELQEALCNVNIEAMAAKVPLVSTNVGAIREVVTHEETGLLVPPGDPRAMAEAILRLLRDEQLAIGLAKAGYQRFLKFFSSPKAAAEVAEVYEMLGNGKI